MQPIILLGRAEIRRIAGKLPPELRRQQVIQRLAQMPVVAPVTQRSRLQSPQRIHHRITKMRGIGRIAADRRETRIVEFERGGTDRAERHPHGADGRAVLVCGEREIVGLPGVGEVHDLAYVARHAVAGDLDIHLTGTTDGLGLELQLISAVQLDESLAGGAIEKEREVGKVILRG